MKPTHSRVRLFLAVVAAIAGIVVCIGNTVEYCTQPVTVQRSDTFAPNESTRHYRVSAVAVDSISVQISGDATVRWVNPPAVFDAGVDNATFTPTSIDARCGPGCGSSCSGCDEFELEVSRTPSASSGNYTLSVTVYEPCDLGLEELRVEPE